MVALPLTLEDAGECSEAVLVLPGGERVGALLRHDGAMVSIGRTPDAAIQIADVHASRIHAMIRWDEMLQTHVISDCGSTNGTFVDDVRVTSPIRLISGSCIRIGATELQYEVPASRTRRFQ